jgi:hypothetical protein
VEKTTSLTNKPEDIESIANGKEVKKEKIPTSEKAKLNKLKLRKGTYELTEASSAEDDCPLAQGQGSHLSSDEPVAARVEDEPEGTASYFPPKGFIRQCGVGVYWP